MPDNFSKKGFCVKCFHSTQDSFRGPQTLLVNSNVSFPEVPNHKFIFGLNRPKFSSDCFKNSPTASFSNHRKEKSKNENSFQFKFTLCDMKSFSLSNLPLLWRGVCQSDEYRHGQTHGKGASGSFSPHSCNSLEKVFL